MECLEETLTELRLEEKAKRKNWSLRGRENGVSTNIHAGVSANAPRAYKE